MSISSASIMISSLNQPVPMTFDFLLNLHHIVSLPHHVIHLEPFPLQHFTYIMDSSGFLITITKAPCNPVVHLMWINCVGYSNVLHSRCILSTQLLLILMWPFIMSISYLHNPCKVTKGFSLYFAENIAFIVIDRGENRLNKEFFTVFNSLLDEVNRLVAF